MEHFQNPARPSPRPQRDPFLPSSATLADPKRGASPQFFFLFPARIRVLSPSSSHSKLTECYFLTFPKYWNLQNLNASRHQPKKRAWKSKATTVLSWRRWCCPVDSGIYSPETANLCGSQISLGFQPLLVGSMEGFERGVEEQQLWKQPGSSSASHPTANMKFNLAAG